MNISSNYLDTIWAVIIVLPLFIFGYLIRRSKSTRSLKAPPAAAGAWPIIGHLHLLSGRGKYKLPQIALGDLADRYGPIFTIRLGIQPAVVISNSEIAKECFTTHDVALASRPSLVAGKLLGYNNAMFNFAPHGPYWREMRKIAAIELLSNRRLDLLKHVRALEVKASITKLYNLTKDGSKGNEVSVEMKQWFGDLTFDVILRMVAGKRYVDGSQERRRFRNLMHDFFRLLGVFVVRDAIPWLGWLDIGGHEKDMKKTAKDLDNLANEWLDEHRRKRASGDDQSDGDDQDFMDVMLSILDGASFAGFDGDTVNKATSMALIAAGTDTTVATLSWALTYLLNNPHVLKKAQEELDIHIGKERLVTESDIEKLPYFQATVKEILRIRPPVALAGFRELTEDCVIGGYHVSKGTRLILNLSKIHNDPQSWRNPEKFEPERFMNEHKDVDVRGQNFEVMPFGAGRRTCSGASFALIVVKLALANYLHAFNYSTLNDAPVDMSEILGLVSIKSTPLDVLITPRLSSCAY